MTNLAELTKSSKIPSKSELIEEGYFFLVNKPVGWTSFDVVKKIRLHFGIKKIGHSGTLDPNASGLLIIATGKKTKEIEKYSALDKEYKGVLVLGAKTRSYDSETEIIENKNYSFITKKDIENVFAKFEGDILQTPPIYSAVKYRGKPLYKYARKGKEIDIKPREVSINSLKLIDFNLPEVAFVVRCSKGTYVRSLVNDIGEKLGCGAYLKSLIRTRIGNFNLDDAFEINELTKSVS